MDDLNTSQPMIMHIDLNSCFATVEQQSRPLLRHRPVAVVNRTHDNSVIVTASYEAKGRGVKVGMRLKMARLLCPDLVAIESDPPKYRYVYRKLLDILADYSPSVRMKSIDEGVINFSDSPVSVREGSDLLELGREIKTRLRGEIGEYMRCNVGIGTNQFLAKTAAGLNKPDGLVRIDYKNLLQVYERLDLEDLTGIAGGFGKRLRQFGINSPLEFLEAKREVLERQVFKSKLGAQWYKRLRGWEVDDVIYGLKSIGRQFVMDKKGGSYDDVLARLYSLCEDVAFKMRWQRVVANAVKMYVKPDFGDLWQAHIRQDRAFDDEGVLFSLVRQMFASAPLPAFEIGVTCYGLSPSDELAPDLFGEIAKTAQLTGVIDEINESWGSRTVHSATTLGLDRSVRDKVPFGSTRFL